MTTLRNAGKHRAGIELEEVKEQHVYENFDRRCVETYNNLETERKTQTDDTSKENMDKTKVVIVVLSVVVTALVVAVVAIVAVSSNVYFEATDGGWADWEDWGTCSVTCGLGFTTRIRTCSNPRPSIMGHYCDGTSVQVLSTSLQVQTCNKSSCSITDGKWTSWGDWDACSVIWGGGLITRSRTCSNPQPSTMGKYCNGTSVQMKICNNISCSVHGGWTEWSNWNTCSVTCGIGIERRHRNCSNPVPEQFGYHCYDDTLDDIICLPGPCANGGWSDWGHWSSCTVTCGDGLQSRSRTCTRPLPSPLGKYCEGDSLNVMMCKKPGCTPNIVFKAKGVIDRSPTVGQTMIFGTTLVNEGHAYNTSTGVFVAPVNGTYYFSTQLCTTVKSDLYIVIIVDGVTYATLRIHDPDVHSCNTADTVGVLHAQSKVWLKCIYVNGSGTAIIIEYGKYMNSFSGYLVHR